MAWHGLTEIVPDLSLENNWLKTWDIQPQPLMLKGPDVLNVPGEVATTEPSLIETGFALLTATDNPSITIGVPFNPNSYRPITNAEFLQLLKDSTEGIEGNKLVSIGSVRNRGRVFASFQTAELTEFVAGGRQFKPFLNFGNGHDKSSVLWANTSNICTVCDNTFSMNLAEVEQAVVQAVNARHTKNIALRLPEIGAMIRHANQMQQNFALAFETLSSTQIGEASAEAILTGFVAREESDKLSTRAKNIIARLMDLFRGGRGNKGQTLADLFSAVTEYYTHENAGNSKNPRRQFQSAEFGTGNARKQEFWKLVNSSDDMQKMIEAGAKIVTAEAK